ncbi:MAG: O-acetyl-ADP-ribose deacetylase [Acutalibacteraceae bacterium]
MPVKIIRGDITKLHVDVVVNAANSSLLGGGGVDGCIHRAAGRELLNECRLLGGCKTGDAKITKGYNMPCKYIIHTVGPVWRGGHNNEPELLASCYRKSLELAAEHGCTSIAFPLISSGVYGYPKDKAIRVAMDTVKEYIFSHDDIDVYIVVYNRDRFEIDEKLYSDVNEYINANLPEMYSGSITEQEPRMNRDIPDDFDDYYDVMSIFSDREGSVSAPLSSAQEYLTEEISFADSLESMLDNMDESFSDALLHIIDSKGMTDVQCYKKANISRKHFSKIRSDVNYRPGKSTVIAFAIALELNLDETQSLLRTAGFALSHSNKFDIIIEYFIIHGTYDIFQINETLFKFGQATIGG